MASIRLIRNPFKPFEIEIFEAQGRIIDWLVDFAPKGFSGPIVIYLNAVKLDVDAWDYSLTKGDVVVIAVQPGDGGIIVGALANILVALAVNYIAFQIFGPKVPEDPAFSKSENTIYSLAPSQNAAKVGGVIPVIYGEVLTTPDYAAQPYIEYTKPVFRVSESDTSAPGVIQGTQFYSPTGERFFLDREYTLYERYRDASQGNVVKYLERFDVPIGFTGGLPLPGPEHLNWILSAPNTNQIWLPEQGFFQPGTSGYINLSDFDRRGAGDQWLYYFLCLGHGEHIVHDVLLGDISAKKLPPQDVQWLHMNPLYGGNPFGAFAQQFNNKFSLDGAFHENVFTSLEVGAQEFDDVMTSLWYPVSDQEIDRIAVDISFDRGLYRINDDGDFRYWVYTMSVEWDGPSSGSMTVLWRYLYSTSPYRRTLEFDVPKGAGYRVRVTRETAKTTGNDSTRVADDFRWAGLRGYIATPLTQTYYSGTSLVGLRIRASERLSSAAEKRVRVRATRRLPIYGYGYNLSKNPISAVIDTLLNEHYGAQLSANELDIPLMLKLYNYWGGASTEHGFNAVFDGKSTIYEALRTMLAGNAAEPLPVGGMVSVAYEGARDFPMMIFGEANIIKGTFQLSYQFDKIGDYNAVRVQYRTLDTWQPEYAYYPDDDPTNRFLGVELFGCTSSDHALQFATYTYNKRFLIRKTINFETELEGLIPRAGDLIGLSHSLPKWSVSGYITAYNPSTMVILLDREVEGFGFSGSEGTLILRQDNGTGIDYITGQLISPREVQISSQPAFNIYGSVSDTPTLFIWGENNSAVRLFTITNIEPRGGVQVSITAQEYKPEAFENAMPYLENSLT